MTALTAANFRGLTGLLAFALTSASPVAFAADVTRERLENADREPQNWLTYSGSYQSWRYSSLDQINKQNVGSLKVAWVQQMPTSHRIEATPIVVDGIMYTVQAPNDVVALDAATGRIFWKAMKPCGARSNGVASAARRRCPRCRRLPKRDCRATKCA